MKVFDVIANVMLIIGGMILGVMGFFDFNVVSSIFGEGSVFADMLYALVGLSALYDVVSFSFGYKAMHHRWCESPLSVKH